MGRLNAVLTPDDLKKGELVEVGWHPMKFIEYDEADAETDGSLNIFLTFKITDGSGKGVSVRKLFNEKALGFGKNLWKTFGIPYDPDKGVHLTADMLEAKVGTDIKGYIKRGKSNKGNEFNDLVDYMPIS